MSISISSGGSNPLCCQNVFFSSQKVSFFSRGKDHPLSIILTAVVRKLEPAYMLLTDSQASLFKRNCEYSAIAFGDASRPKNERTVGYYD